MSRIDEWTKKYYMFDFNQYTKIHKLYNAYNI